MKNEKHTKSLEAQASARWRIVGWIVLATAITMLATIISVRSILLGQVNQAANDAIVQEIEEFQIFANQEFDPGTASNASEIDLIETYLSRQTPATNETLIGHFGDEVIFLDNASNDAGELIARDEQKLQQLLTSSDTSGIDETEHGPMRWGRYTSDNGVALIVLEFTGPGEEEVNQQTFILLSVAVGGLILTAAIAWLVAGKILRPINKIKNSVEKIQGDDLSKRIPIEGDDDTTRAAESINSMLDRIEYIQGTEIYFLKESIPDAMSSISSKHSFSSSNPPKGQQEEKSPLLILDQTSRRLSKLQKYRTSSNLKLANTSIDKLLSESINKMSKEGFSHKISIKSTPDIYAEIDPEAIRLAFVQIIKILTDHSKHLDEIVVDAEILNSKDSAGGGTYTDSAVKHDGGSVIRGKVLRIAINYQGEFIQEWTVEEIINCATLPDKNNHGNKLPFNLTLGISTIERIVNAHHGSLWATENHTGIAAIGLDIPFKESKDS